MKLDMAQLQTTTALPVERESTTRLDPSASLTEAPSAPPPPLFFTKLPREIRNLVYKYAYAERDTITIVSVSDWMEKERERRASHNRVLLLRQRRQPFTPRSQPVCPLLGMRVNKLFYYEAVAEYLHNTTLEFHGRYYNHRGIRAIVEASSDLKTSMSHFKGDWTESMFSTKYHGYSSSDLLWLKDCKSIKTLHLTVSEDAFSIFKNRLACVDDFSRKDFKSLLQVWLMSTLPGLQNVQLSPEPSKLAATELEREKWQQTVAALNAYINEKLKQSQEARKNKKRSRDQANDAGEVRDGVADDAISRMQRIAGVQLRAIKRRKVVSAQGTAAAVQVQRRTTRRLGGLMDFARGNPAVTAVMTTGLVLSMINSAILAKQLF